MREDTTAKMIAESALNATLERLASIVEAIEPVTEDLLGRGEFALTLRNGRRYRFVVSEAAKKL